MKIKSIFTADDSHTHCIHLTVRAEVVASESDVETALMTSYVYTYKELLTVFSLLSMYLQNRH